MTISRNLSRRLERLEEQAAPLAEPRVWQIVISSIPTAVDVRARRSNGRRRGPFERFGNATDNGRHQAHFGVADLPGLIPERMLLPAVSEWPTIHPCRGCGTSTARALHDLAHTKRCVSPTREHT